ncbi:VOC family protein [Rhodopseudomonas palustris]|uniref:Bleomycin resistance protein n=1 Tax=Rhodopseudomonas palustris TaxID=1076 RepID=A0A323UDA1_RHOPL|nr:glyoxalase superfamily protein [Rhodopseudomonas palustris]PZA10694.1 VOC family protein [Rhodopseudomonas palustris]
MATGFKRVTPTLRMFDTAKAREFYLDFLGFSVVFEHRFEPALPLFMRVRLDEAELNLSEHHGDASPGASVTIATSGLAEYRAVLLAKAYGYARPGLVNQPWGDTTMTVTDPFFNRLIFSESLGHERD